MPISYPITLPTLPGFLSFNWAPESYVAVTPNEFTSSHKVHEWEGKCRKASVEVGPMYQRDARLWQSAMYKLNGRAGTFYLQDPVQFAVEGAIKDAVGYAGKVNGANQVGSDLVTDGWPTSLVGMFKEGDYIAIANRLYFIMDDATSAGGAATLSIWPHAARDLADNADILVGVNAKGIFRLLEWPEMGWDVEHMMNGFAFSCEEAL